MICGGCGHPFSLFRFMEIHWIQTGCNWGREIWRRVFASKREGHSGRRILSKAFPKLYPSEPMPEELVAYYRTKESAN